MAQQELQKLNIGIGGMTCANCSARVERALNRVEGVSTASVNLATGRRRCRMAGAVSAELIADTIRQAGYSVLETGEGQAAADAEREAREEQLGKLRQN